MPADQVREAWEREVRAIQIRDAVQLQRLRREGRLLVYLEATYAAQGYSTLVCAHLKWAHTYSRQDYEATTHWWLQRTRTLERDLGCYGRRRHECRGALRPHHFSYVHVGEEDEWRDMVPVCRTCHDWVHGKDRAQVK
jgi:hypothetical protein